jgi:hypothetical protein
MKVILGLAVVLGSMSAYSATQGDITISGTVDPELSLTLSATSYSNLDIINGGDHSVATATENCNDLDGYKIFGYSTNGSELQNQATPTVKTSYTVKYDGGSAVTLGSSAANKVQLKDSGALTSSVSNSSTVVVNVNAYSNAPAGVYQDVVTLQIVAN